MIPGGLWVKVREKRAPWATSGRWYHVLSVGPQAEDRCEGEEISDVGAAEFEVTSGR